MAALTAIALAVSAAAAVGGYAQQRKAAKQQRIEADRAALATSLEAQANQMAQDSANKREQASATVKQNEQLAAQEASQAADATVEDVESTNQRRRRVQAQFNVAGSGANQATTGSIRV